MPSCPSTARALDPKMTQPAQHSQPPRRSELERALALALRTLHLVAVVALGAALLGAPLARQWAGVGVLATGALLFAQDLHARRIALGEAAGTVVLLKAAAVAWVSWAPQHALAVFWALLVLSSLSSHAPKRWRHARWRRG
jgi:hypothetical protein